MFIKWFDIVILKNPFSLFAFCTKVSIRAKTQRPAIHFLYFAFCRYFTNFFAKHTTKCETLAITFCISGKFLVLLMPQKNKPRNPLSFRANEGVRNRKKVAQNTPQYTFVFRYTDLFFIFRAHFCIFRGKCIVGQRISWFIFSRH